MAAHENKKPIYQKLPSKHKEWRRCKICRLCEQHVESINQLVSLCPNLDTGEIQRLR